MTTMRDNADFVDRWQGGGEDDQWLLHRTAVNCPATNNHHPHLPGWRLEDQQPPQVEEDNNFVGLGEGADKAAAALRPSAEDRAASNCSVDEANEGKKEMAEERRSNVVW